MTSILQKIQQQPEPWRDYVKLLTLAKAPTPEQTARMGALMRELGLTPAAAAEHLIALLDGVTDDGATPLQIEAARRVRMNYPFLFDWTTLPDLSIAHDQVPATVSAELLNITPERHYPAAELERYGLPAAALERQPVPYLERAGERVYFGVIIQAWALAARRYIRNKRRGSLRAERIDFDPCMLNWTGPVAARDLGDVFNIKPEHLRGVPYVGAHSPAREYRGVDLQSWARAQAEINARCDRELARLDQEEAEDLAAVATSTRKAV